MLASAASLAHWLANCRLRGRICLITRQVLAAPLPGAGSRSDDVPNMCQRHLFLSLSSFIHLLFFFFSFFFRLILVLLLFITLIGPKVFLCVFFHILSPFYYSPMSLAHNRSALPFKTAKKNSGGLGFRIHFRKNTLLFLLYTTIFR